VAILPGAGHFFHGRLQDLKDTIWKHAAASGTTPRA
jgi:alpha/beta superfamily hydrolase